MTNNKKALEIKSNKFIYKNIISEITDPNKRNLVKRISIALPKELLNEKMFV